MLEKTWISKEADGDRKKKVIFSVGPDCECIGAKPKTVLVAAKKGPDCECIGKTEKKGPDCECIGKTQVILPFSNIADAEPSCV